jgi:ABC-type uncharacterized transport system involved in gliding motility auxiliary subunit
LEVAMSAASKGQVRWRNNALLSVVLVLACVALGARLARSKFDFEIDLTEEQLSRPSPVGVAMLHGLEDVLEVRAYFTGEVELGIAQLAKRRLVDQLEEVRRLARGKVALTYRDPNGSSEARAEALALGLVPQTIGAQQGTSAVTQDLYLGLVLRYRGREESLPFILPQSFEYAFLSSVRRLERGGEITIGLLAGAGDGSADEFGKLRELLGDGRKLVNFTDLDVSGAVPAQVKVVVVAGPRDLHPRAAFALDQFLQRGGRLAVFTERNQVSRQAASLSTIDSGVDILLDTWGASLSERVVWDIESMNPVRTRETVEIAGREELGPETYIPYPAWVRVSQEGMNADEVVTARLPGVDLYWVNPFLPFDSVEVPATLERIPLLESSAKSYAIAPESELVDINPARVRERTLGLQATSEQRVLPLGLILRGRFPTAFGAGAPEPYDPVADALFERTVAEATEARLDPPEAPAIGFTDEPVLDGAADAVVVAIGDADWVRSDLLTSRNAMAVEDLVDWLSLEEDLLALRARQPIQRPLRNFLTEARGELGLPPMLAGQSISTDDIVRLRLEEDAVHTASIGRLWWMGFATGGALILALAIGFLGRLLLGAVRLEGDVAP